MKSQADANVDVEIADADESNFAPIGGSGWDTDGEEDGEGWGAAVQARAPGTIHLPAPPPKAKNAFTADTIHRQSSS